MAPLIKRIRKLQRVKVAYVYHQNICPFYVEYFIIFIIFILFSFSKGLTHHHRSIVATQKELDAVPKVKVVSSHKQPEDEILTSESIGAFSLCS